MVRFTEFLIEGDRFYQQQNNPRRPVGDGQRAPAGDRSFKSPYDSSVLSGEEKREYDDYQKDQKQSAPAAQQRPDEYSPGTKKSVDLTHWDKRAENGQFEVLQNGKAQVSFTWNEPRGDGPEEVRLVQKENEDLPTFRKRVKRIVANQEEIQQKENKADEDAREENYKNFDELKKHADGNKVYLTVPYKDKDRARKELPIRWNPMRKAWYVDLDVRHGWVMPILKKNNWISQNLGTGTKLPGTPKKYRRGQSPSS